MDTEQPPAGAPEEPSGELLIRGFEQMMDNVGAVFGPLLTLGLVATVGVRWAIGLAVEPT